MLLLSIINDGKNQNRVFLIFIFLATLTTGTKISLKKYYDHEWVGSHFPIVVDPFLLPLSEQCVNDTMMQLAALRNGLPWAIEMYESSGSLKDKIVETGSGNVHHDMGLFDQCLAAVDPRRESDFTVTFQGKYCTVFFDDDHHIAIDMAKLDDGSDTAFNESISRLSNEAEPVENVSNFVKPSVSFCIPSSCSARHLRSAVAQRVRDWSLVASTSEDYCYTKDKIRTDSTFDTGAIVTSFVIGALILLTVTATVHDAFLYDNKLDGPKKERMIEILHCFSATKNGRALLSTTVNDSDNLSCLHGLRFFSMLLIIAYHSSLRFAAKVNNTHEMFQYAARLEAQFFTNGTIFVETFFLMSGLLVCLSLMRQLDRSKGSFNVSRYYCHRYLRLTPLYAVVVAFVANLLPLISSGPDWNYVKQLSGTTRRLWWSQLLYINNYVPKVDIGWNSGQSGMAETWYLACDMQMFWLSPLLIYPLWKWKKAGLVWVVACLSILLVASTVPFILIPDLQPTIFSSRFTIDSLSKLAVQWDNYYRQTYCRLPPYIIGILLGCLLHRTKDRENIQLNKFVVAVGWSVSTFTAVSIVFGLTLWFDEDALFAETLPDFGSIMRISYGAFHRSAFALCVAWIIFACTRQHGGFVSGILSCKLFVPLGRLCYGAYLINFNFIKAYSSSMRNPAYFNQFDMYLTYFGIIIIIFLVSFVASVTVEMPFLNLDKLLFSDRITKTKDQQDCDLKAKWGSITS